MCDMCSNIVIRLSILDMWSVLFVMYVDTALTYMSSDCTECTGHVVSVILVIPPPTCVVIQ